ncbi:MAG TPA: TolC family protein [Steroidobacteraceae bacterium]|nr:TolC family protein [Steroidobacteraceae bacterium]
MVAGQLARNHFLPSRRRQRWAACVLLLIPWVGHAESLADAWAMALRSDGALAAAHSELAAAEAERSAALRQRWPSLDLNGNYTRLLPAPQLDIATPAGRLLAPIWQHDGYAAAGADLSVPVWTSGRTGGAIGAAAAGARGAAAQEAGSTAEVKLAVAEAYIAVFRARRALAVAESNVASLKAHHDDVQVMYDKQAVPQSDLLGAQVSFANAQQQRLRAANGLHLAAAAYNRWVGQPLDRAPELDEPSTLPAPDTGEALDQLVAHALNRRPEIAVLAAQQEKFEQAARSEVAQGLPQVALHAGYNHFDNQILDRENFASVGIGFQWRIFDSGRLNARASALRSHARATGQQLADLRSVVALQVETALLDREEAAARIHAAGATVNQAEENVRDAKELYTNGLGTSNQVLDAESLRVVALTNRDNAAFDLLIAQFRLQRALGDL